MNTIHAPKHIKKLTIVIIGWKAGNNRTMTLHIPVMMSIRPGSEMSIAACAVFE
jgi:hypothetical protein